jgi:hypothetical protein
VLTKDEARRIAAKRGAVAGAGEEGRGLIPSGDKGHVTEVASQAPVCTRKRTRFAKGLGSGFGTGDSVVGSHEFFVLASASICCLLSTCLSETGH